MRKFIKFCINSFVLFIFSTHYILADTDYNQAKKLLDAGEILSLEKILAKISTQYPGHILEVELEIEDNISLYEIELVDTKGQVWEFKINARTGKIIERKQDD